MFQFRFRSRAAAAIVSAVLMFTYKSHAQMHDIHYNNSNITSNHNTTATTTNVSSFINDTISKTEKENPTKEENFEVSYHNTTEGSTSSTATPTADTTDQSSSPSNNSYNSNTILYERSINLPNGSRVGPLIIHSFQISQEPVDIIHEFVSSLEIETELAQQIQITLLKDVCMFLRCTRSQPLLFQSPILSENGQFVLGTFEFLDGTIEEPVDVLHAFFTRLLQASNPTDSLEKHLKEYKKVILNKLCSVVSCKRRYAVLYQVAVLGIDDQLIGNFQYTDMDGSEPIDAIFQFIKSHDLNEEYRKLLVQNVCSKIPCKRFNALLAQIQLDSDGKVFEYFEGDGEPIDAIQRFLIDNNLSIVTYREAMLNQLCNTLNTCTRTLPIIWQKNIQTDSGYIQLNILEGEEPVDVIYREFPPHLFTLDQRQRIMQLVKQDGNVPYTHEYTLISEKEILNEKDVLIDTIQFYDDLNEPIDTLYNMIQQHPEENLSLERLKQDILLDSTSGICIKRYCGRYIPIVFTHKFSTPINTVMSFLQNQEPIDAIDEFLLDNSHQINGMNSLEMLKEYRTLMLDQVCQNQNCTRTIPVVYRKSVTQDDKSIIGDVEIYEGQEVIDAVYTFLQEYEDEYLLDSIQLKNYFLGEACTSVGKRVKCTRNVAKVLDQPVLGSDGKIVGSNLIIYENQEPADVIHEWFKLTPGLEEDFLFSLIYNVCTLVLEDQCTRKAPLLYGPQPISDADGETIVGVFQVEMRQEPIDAIYQFFSKNKLWEKGWDMKPMWNQICSFDEFKGKCNRDVAVKYYDANFTIGVNNYTLNETLVIWEHQEVIDVLYQIRRKYNLTYQDQMVKFSEICSSEKIHCGRTKAEIFRLSDINYNDYPRKGNETCGRRFAGWQYLASVSQSKIGSKVIEFMNSRDYKEVLTKYFLENVFIGIVMFVCLLLWFHLVFYIIFYVMSTHQKLQRKISLERLPSEFITTTRMIKVYVIFLVYYSLFFSSFLQTLFIEPTDRMDKAMHQHEGKLPDLVLYEGDEPVDTLLDWAKNKATKIHHPIVRMPIYYQLLDQLCDVSPEKCERRRAWEYVDMGSVTQFGQQYNLSYWNPKVDPIARLRCINDTNTNHDLCIEKAAAKLCQTIYPPVNDCVPFLTNHMTEQIITYEKNRVDSKKTYIRLEMEMDCPDDELFEKSSMLARSHGINVSPYKSVFSESNQTIPYLWQDPISEGFGYIDAFYKVKDPESREWEDKPCEPVFGGAMCMKTDKDGNMKIEV